MEGFLVSYDGHQPPNTIDPRSDKTAIDKNKLLIKKIK